VTAYEQTTEGAGLKDRSDSITQLVFRSIHSSKAIRALFRVPLAAMRRLHQEGKPTEQMFRKVSVLKKERKLFYKRYSGQ